MKTLSEKYEELCNTPSDIYMHLPILKEYASKCDHITEMGVRAVVSTYALLMGRPQKLIGYDIGEYKAQIEECEEIAESEGLNWSFVLADVLRVEIEPTDMLLIDTYHTATQLDRELKLHAHKVKKYIAFHDTFTFWVHGEESYGSVSDKGTNCGRGLKYAIEPFLESHPEWREIYRTDANNGMLIIERI